MAQIKTVNWWIVCKDCGKRANRITRPENAGPPPNTPSMPGKCPSAVTSTGNHRPNWERQG